MNTVQMVVGASVLSCAVDLAANALMPGRNATQDFASTSNLLQYGLVGIGSVAVGGAFPSIAGRTTAGAGALRAAQFGAAVLGGWAAAEVVSQQLGI